MVIVTFSKPFIVSYMPYSAVRHIVPMIINTQVDRKFSQNGPIVLLVFIAKDLEIKQL